MPVKFRVRDGETVVVIEVDIEGGRLSPDELMSLNPPKVDGSKAVAITGRVPLWLAAFLAHEYHYARELAFFVPQTGAFFVVSGAREGRWIDETGREVEVSGWPPADKVGSPELRAGVEGGIGVLHFSIRDGAFLDPADVIATAEAAAEATEEIGWRVGFGIEGKMPLILAAAVAAKAANAGRWFGVYDPRRPGFVVVASHHEDAPNVGEVVPYSPPAPKPTYIVGVVGDPNSGKSVFLALLDVALRSLGLTTLTQEGDLTAPTQGWSFYAPDLRRRLKSRMDPAARLEWIVRSLSALRESGAVDVVLVDVGGGRPDLGVRVTDENLAILQGVDAVVVCSRNDESQIDAWLEEIAAKLPGLDVLAILESVYPDPRGERSGARVDGGVVVGTVGHLDREALAAGQVPTATVRVAEEVARVIAGRVRGAAANANSGVEADA